MTACVATLAVGGTFLTPASEATAAPDELECFGATATILGTPGDDVIRGTNGPDVIVSGRGDDRINGRGGDDLICGRSGNDRISGGKGDDRIRGWRGEDRISGGPGNDRLLGGPHTDRLLGGAGDDALDGGPADDECDGGSGTNTLLHCEVSPNAAPMAVDDTGTTDEDSVRTLAVVANDTDPDGDSLSISSVATAGTKGTVTVTGGGAGLTYDPHGQFDALAPGASGTDSFTYMVSDGRGGTDVAAVTVTVTGVDDAPVAVTDSTTVAEDASATTVAVRTNDTDVDGGPKTMTAVTQPAHGTVVITNGGDDLTYAPVADYCNTPPPSDDFTYTLNGGSTATVHVTVTCVDDAPVVDLNGASGGGVNATASFTEDSGPVVVAPAAQVVDVDNANLVSATFTLTNRPDGVKESLSVDTTGTSVTASSFDSSTGVLTLSGSDTVVHYQQVLRSLSYANSSDIPDLSDRVVDVLVNDGSLDSNQPHSTVSISAHNDAPTATDQSAATDEDTAKGITLAGTDPEGDPLAFAHDASSVHGGTVTGAGTSVTYTPAADYCGPDSFDFTVDDGNGGTDTGTVSLTVTCVDDAPVVDLNGAGGGGANATAGFTEDSGPVAVAPGAELSDVDNGQLVSATLTLTNRPDGNAESLSVDTTGTSITASSYDSSTGVLTLSGSDTVAHYQQVVRSLSYANSSDTPSTVDRVVDVKVNDGTLDSNQPHSTISVSTHNDAPHATDQSGLSTAEETPLPVTLAGTDPEGDPLTFSHDATSAQGGTVTGAGTSVTYTPAGDYCGADSFGFSVDDGNGGTDTGTVSTTVTCVDDAPVVDLNGAAAGRDNSATFAEQVSHTGGDVALAPAGTIADVDDSQLGSLTVTLTNHPDGSSEVLTVDTTGTSITADSYNPSTGVLLLHGADTRAHYEQVLRTVSYRNDAAPPDSTDRSVTFVADDGDLDSDSRTTTVTVVPLNAKPVLDLDNTLPGADAGASFAEDGGPVALAPHAEVTDADDPDLASATVTLTTRPDGVAELLSADTTGTSITADAYVPGSGVLLLHGSDTLAHYQQVLRTVDYRDTSDTPTTSDRTVTVQVSDGQDGSNVASVTVAVAADNDAPTATDQSVTTDEDTAKGITLAGTDPDGDPLTLTHDATSALGGTVTGAGSSVTYTPAADRCGPDSFGFSVDDGNGGTDTGTVSITVTCVNDAPVVDLNGAAGGIDDNASFTEDQPAVALAPSATVTDVDDVDLASATVTLANRPDGGLESLSADTTGTSITAGYTSATGVLTLTGPDSVAHYQQVLRSVAYNDSSDTPDTSDRTITWVANDGSLDSATASTTLSVSAANDPPTLDLNGAGAGVDETASYTEDQPATTLAPNAVAVDPDNANLQSATVTLTNHPDGVAESLSVDTSGTSIGAATYNSGTGVLVLSGSDTVAHYQQVLRTVLYLDTSQNAAPADRVVNFVVHDGVAGSNSPKVTVTITVVNDPPVVDLNGGGVGIDSNAAFVEDSAPNVVGSGPVNLGASATVSDVDNAGLATATLTLTNHPDGVNESLSVNLAGSPHIATGGYNSTTGVLTLSGGPLATTAEFQAALQSAKYNNTSNTPDPTDRDVTVKVNDGAADSGTAHTTISVTPTNDAPVAVDETFNGASSAVGNTTLSVNDTANHGGAADGRIATPDPTDTSPVSDRPFKGVTGDILSNDTDPEQAGSALTVTPGTFATNDGGTVTIQADGDFNFEPAASTSCTDPSDFFDYTVTDNAAADVGSDTGRVTVAITGCVWYVDNDDAQGNSGTSEKPFDSLVQAQTASANGQSIFVYDGNDTSTGYNAGVVLKVNQKLVGEAATLSVGGDTLHVGDAANRPTLTNNNADVVTLASGTAEMGLAIDPQGTGGGICGGTACGGATNPDSGTIDDVTIVDNGTKGTQPGLELNGTTGTFNISNLVVNNGDGSSATNTDEGVKLNSAGTVNFAAAGTISITTNGAAGLDAAAGVGPTSLGSASAFDDITVTNSANGGVLLAGTTGSGTAFGDASGNDLQLSTVSGSAAAFRVQTSGSFSVPTAGQSDVTATGGPAVDVVGSAGSTMAFDGVSSTNSANDGINLDGLGTGTFSAASGAVGGEAGIGFDLNAGSGAITYPGAFNNGSGPLVAEVTGRTGGVVSLAGNMFDTNDTGGGISESGNTGGSTVYSGATKQYNTGSAAALSVSNPDGSTHTAVWSGGGTDIDTTSGNGVDVTGVGPTADGSIQFSGTGNTIDSTALSGNRALNIADVNLTATGVGFQRISASGGTNGVRLSDTGAAGPFTITGIGSAGSGGTITGSTGAGIDLTGVGNGAAFDRMIVQTGGDDGLRANDVTKLTLYNSSVTGNGNAVNENGLDLADLKGVSGIKNTTVSGSADFNALVSNSSTTPLELTVTGNTFSGAGIDDGLQVDSDANAVIKSNIAGNTFSNNHGDAIQIANVDGAGDSSQQDVTINNNTITGSGSTSVDGGIVVQSADNEKLKASVTNNNITGVSVSALILNPGPNGVASSTFDATASNNTIGTLNVADSGSADGDGIQVKSATDGDARIAVTNNTIRNYDKNGMMLRASESNQSGHSTQLTATGNQISQPDATNSETGILLEAGSSSTDVLTACADVGGAGALANTFGGILSPAAIGNFWLSLRFANSVLQAPGYAPTGTLAGRQAYFFGRNTGFNTGAAPYVEDGTKDMANHSGACTQPSAPTLPTPSP